MDKRRLGGVSASFRSHDVRVVGMDAFPPLPYSPFRLAAGLARLNPHRFVLRFARRARDPLLRDGTYRFWNEQGVLATDYPGLTSLCAVGIRESPGAA